MEGMKEMAAALKSAIAEKEQEVRGELLELGNIHRERLATPGGCPCTVPGSGRCIVADTIERGMEELSNRPMPPAAGSCFN